MNFVKLVFGNTYVALITKKRRWRPLGAKFGAKLVFEETVETRTMIVLVVSSWAPIPYITPLSVPVMSP